MKVKREFESGKNTINSDMIEIRIHVEFSQYSKNHPLLMLDSGAKQKLMNADMAL